MHRPLIGVSTSFEQDEQRLSHHYVSAIEQAGGLPVILPMLSDEVIARELANVLHGLVLTGGPAITDGLIGQLPDDLDEPDHIRSNSDRTLVTAFMNARHPILGVCYGMQLMNALAGGTIYGDVERQSPGSLVHSEKRGGNDHAVVPEQNSHFASIMGASAFEVNTRHIQAVAKLGDGFEVSARSPDGVIEAIESEDGLYLGVQFHPERMGRLGLGLFRDVVLRAEAIRQS